MDIESNSSKGRKQSLNSRNSHSLNLFALIDHEHQLTPFTPYRSNFELYACKDKATRSAPEKAGRAAIRTSSTGWPRRRRTAASRSPARAGRTW
jgi:hypothetical protein